MAKIITLANQKGGVGKTTSTNALAVCLKHKGYKVLCVDFDPQSNLSFSMNADLSDKAPKIYDAIKRAVKVRHTIQRTGIVDIIPADLPLSGLELEFTSRGREFILRDCLAQVAGQYDYILIDSPPALGILTINAFAAADIVLIPCLPDAFSLQGTRRLHETITRVKPAINPGLLIGGIFIARFYPREDLSNVAWATAEEMARGLNVPLLRTRIRHSSVLSRAQILQKDIIQYAPKNPAVKDYITLADELLKGGL
ncbi:MAG: ParA family protein [Peptococcaceae bacterium]|jgi:chromosome partitioning protein|nr:ParA family protein [Peptococcaceae bacterium]